MTEQKKYYLICGTCGKSYEDTAPLNYFYIGADRCRSPEGHYCGGCGFSFCEKCGGVGDKDNDYLCTNCEKRKE